MFHEGSSSSICGKTEETPPRSLRSACRLSSLAASTGRAAARLVARAVRARVIRRGTAAGPRARSAPATHNVRHTHYTALVRSRLEHITDQCNCRLIYTQYNKIIFSIKV